jgi:NAD(P)-dependent dehydrogenase (short-subunit alcohol dehydrogenase family)
MRVAAEAKAVPALADVAAHQTPVALITGATSDGIGLRVMEGMLKKGFDIVAVARNEARAARLHALAAAHPNRQVHVYYGDLALARDIRQVADNIKAAHPRIDRVVNSLGVMLPDTEKTSEGLDHSEMVNALAPWMLARLLLPCLLQSSDPRILQLNSDGHDVFSEHAPKMFRLYGANKLTALRLNYELARRLQSAQLPVRVNSVHPGYVRTELGRHMDKAGPKWQRPLWILGRWLHTRTADGPQTAAAPIIALATDAAYKDETGAYFDGKRKAISSPASRDVDAWATCWDACSDLVGLPRELSDTL